MRCYKNMPSNPEQLHATFVPKERGEDFEQERADLANAIAVLVGHGRESFLRSELARGIEKLPADLRQPFLEELERLTKQAGWQWAHRIVVEGIRVEDTVQRSIQKSRDVIPYAQSIRRPEEIKQFKDFWPRSHNPFESPKGGLIHFWVPTKQDIRTYVMVARVAHEKSGRTGPVRILEVGGGSGFLSKLIADELQFQGIESEVVVTDPDVEILELAKKAYQDTQNMSFEVGTARDSFRRHLPRLDANEAEAVSIFERIRERTMEDCKRKLALIKATLESFEGWSEPADVLSSPFGAMAIRILRDADVTESTPIEHIKDHLAQYYEECRAAFHSELIDLADQQEGSINAAAKDAQFDVVLNSWMPTGLDFTREIRMLAAPAIIYAQEAGGATGVAWPSSWPEDLGSEPSYGPGDRYTEVMNWKGIGTSSLAQSSGIFNVSEVQVRKDLGISSADLLIPAPRDEERYPWEKSLEEYIEEKERTDFLFRSKWQESESDDDEDDDDEDDDESLAV